MTFYSGDKFPKWKGDLFIGGLRSQLILRLEVDGGTVMKEERILEGILGRIRDIRSGLDGYLYLLTDHPDGQLMRLGPIN